MNALAALVAQPKPVKIVLPTVNWAALAPVLILIAGAIVLLVAGSLLRGPKARMFYGPYSALVALAAGLATIPQWHRVQHHGAFTTVAGMFGIDGFSLFATATICAALFLAVLFIDGYLVREDLVGIEPFVLLLTSASGAVVMASANDLITMFVGLEIMSISVYVLAGIHVRRARSGEAALKYFILGGLSSAFFLYGIALVYGATGSTHMAAIADYLAQHAFSNDLLLLTGMMLMIVGFGFKVSAVPFHQWAPDVYQGSPTPVSGFMASVVKVGGFVGFVRVFMTTFGNFQLDWQPVIYAIAIATLVVGSVLALAQTDVKRLLAYSSINHAGFILVAFEQATPAGTESVLFYLAAYSFMVLGSFGVVSLLSRRGDGHTSLADFAGIARKEPALAFLLTVFLLAQAGVPFTVGFVAKFEVLMAAVDGGSWPLALVAMITAVIAAFLYLKVIIVMYGGELSERAAALPRVVVPWGAKLGLALAFVLVVGLGVAPGPMTNLAEHATPHLIALGK
ncbi:MAG: NADH-quinone oxidoreductase subunit N [Actinobacteria bacterium]|nr:NADH-quinone oxidoreductase subunit N [Actinomycetota bacterium]